MKRLLLTLSLICFSWGAGANDFGDKNSVLFKYDPNNLNRSAPINKCLEAAQNGYELSNRTIEESSMYGARQHRKFLYENKLYILSIFLPKGTSDNDIRCHKQIF